jgi:hypothetical protein
MAIGAHDSSDYNSPGWKLVLTTDLLSTFGWAFFMGAVFGLGYSWSGRIPCV